MPPRLARVQIPPNLTRGNAAPRSGLKGRPKTSAAQLLLVAPVRGRFNPSSATFNPRMSDFGCQCAGNQARAIRTTLGCCSGQSMRSRLGPNSWLSRDLECDLETLAHVLSHKLDLQLCAVKFSRAFGFVRGEMLRYSPLDVCTDEC
eukprot:scaffold1832_cov362-Prasinococcus_capsulatus_cf.AAC.13